jgi:hypothetical protein
MKALWMCLIFAVAGLPCLAAETISDTHYFGTDGILWDYESKNWTDNPSVSWTHTLNGLGDFEVTAATLTIDGSGIDNVWWDFDGDGGYEQTDYVMVSFMDQELGRLTGNSTTFSLTPGLIAAVTNANAEITFQNDLLTLQGWCEDYVVDFDWKDSVLLKSSTLSVTFDQLYGNPGPVAVPVPGALVLAGLGTTLVGVLRRRKIA